MPVCGSITVNGGMNHFGQADHVFMLLLKEKVSMGKKQFNVRANVQIKPHMLVQFS